MQRPRKLFRRSLLGAISLCLAACGSGQQAANNGDLLSSVVTQIFNRGTGPAQVSPAQIAQARAATSAGIILAEFETLNSSSLFQEVERNGAVTTFGTANRQSISLENGVIRGTRGLGADLMSTDHSLLRNTLATGQSNGGTRILRYLDASSQTVQMKLSCAYTPGSTVIETCVGEDGHILFENQFEHSGGFVYASRQWVSKELGYARISQIQ